MNEVKRFPLPIVIAANIIAAPVGFALLLWGGILVLLDNVRGIKREYD